MEQFKRSKVSPYLEDKLVFIGQFCCYESGKEIAEKLMGIQISDTSINRINSKMGEQASEWIEAEDPKAQMILDFYHGMENIGKLVKLCIKGNKEKKDWMEKTGKILKEYGIKKARERVERLVIKTKPQIEQKQKLDTYIDRTKTLYTEST